MYKIGQPHFQQAISVHVYVQHDGQASHSKGKGLRWLKMADKELKVGTRQPHASDGKGKACTCSCKLIEKLISN